MRAVRAGRLHASMILDQAEQERLCFMILATVPAATGSLAACGVAVIQRCSNSSQGVAALAYVVDLR